MQARENETAFLNSLRSSPLIRGKQVHTANANLKGMLLSLAGFSLWATGDAVVKYLSAFYSIPVLIFYNVLISCSVLACASLWTGRLERAFKSEKRRLYLLRGLIIFLQMTLAIYAFSHMSLALTYAIVFSTPFITALLARALLGDRITVRQCMTIIAGFCGVLVILRPGLVPLGLPVLAALASSVCFACSNILARYAGSQKDAPLAMILLPQMVVLACAAIPFTFDPVLPAPAHWPHLLYFGLSSGAGMFCMSLGFIKARPALAAPFHYVQMLWGVGLGYVFFGDTLDLWTGIGAAIVIASGLFLIIREQDPRPDAVPAP